MKSSAPLLQQVDRTYVLYRDRKLTYFGGCDYFRLSSHSAVVAAIHSGLEKYGLSVAASRKTTGNHSLHEKLEERLAVFLARLTLFCSQTDTRPILSWRRRSPAYSHTP